MKSTNEELYQEAMAAIRRLFEDISVSQAKAKENLCTLQDEIEVLIESLSL